MAGMSEAKEYKILTLKEQKWYDKNKLKRYLKKSDAKYKLETSEWKKVNKGITLKKWN